MTGTAPPAALPADALGDACRAAGLAVRNGKARALPGAPGPVGLDELAAAGMDARTVAALAAETRAFSQLVSWPDEPDVLTPAAARALMLSLRAVADGRIGPGDLLWLTTLGRSPGALSLVLAAVAPGQRRRTSDDDVVRIARGLAGFRRAVPTAPTGHETLLTLVLPGGGADPGALDIGARALVAAQQAALLGWPDRVLDDLGRWWLAWHRDCPDGTGPDWPDWMGLAARARGADLSRQWALAGDRAGQDRARETSCRAGELLAPMLPLLEAGLGAEHAARALGLPAGHPDRPGPDQIAAMTALRPA